MLDDIVAGVAADAGTVGDARSARRIAAVIGRMITSGELPVGTRLPTVRELSARLGRELRTQLSPRHVPDRVLAVPVVPRTLSGKKLEIPVKRILLGADVDSVASRGSLVDPTALDHFAALDLK